MFFKRGPKPKNIGEGKYGVFIAYKDGREAEIHWMPTAKSRDGLLMVFQSESDVESVSPKNR